jgi:hypothetical protein
MTRSSEHTCCGESRRWPAQNDTAAEPAAAADSVGFAALAAEPPAVRRPETQRMNDETAWRWFPVIFIGGWIGISLLLSWVGGWQELALRYRATESIKGERFWMKSAGMRWGVSYSSCLNFGVDSVGLFLSVVPLFRVGHPTLFIPWSDISLRREKLWLLLDVVRLSFRQVPGASLLLRPKVATQILAHGPVSLDAA